MPNNFTHLQKKKQLCQNIWRKGKFQITGNIRSRHNIKTEMKEENYVIHSWPTPDYIHIYLTPPLGQYMTQGQFLRGV